MIPKLKPYRNEDYLNFVRQKPCGFCGAPVPSEPHHVRRYRWGAGTSQKPTDLVAVPRCRDCHDSHPSTHEQDVEFEIIDLLMEYIEKIS